MIAMSPNNHEMITVGCPYDRSATGRRGRPFPERSPGAVCMHCRDVASPYCRRRPGCPQCHPVGAATSRPSRHCRARPVRDLARVACGHALSLGLGRACDARAVRTDPWPRPPGQLVPRPVQRRGGGRRDRPLPSLRQGPQVVRPEVRAGPGRRDPTPPAADPRADTCGPRHPYDPRPRLHVRPGEPRRRLRPRPAPRTPARRSPGPGRIVPRPRPARRARPRRSPRAAQRPCLRTTSAPSPPTTRPAQPPTAVSPT